MNYFKTFGFLTFLFTSLSLLAQDYEWSRVVGSTSDDRSYAVSVDPSGNIVSTGYFAGTVDFDPGAGTSNLSSSGANDVFVQKIDGNGNFLWAKSFGGSILDEGRSIATDASGNIYITGYFMGTVDFDPGAATTNLTSAGGNDVFVQKLDPLGNLLWARSFGGSSNDVGNSIHIDPSGNAVITGFFQGTVDFDPGTGNTSLSSEGNYDIFIQKIDASGSFVWARSFGGTSLDESRSITTDDLGNVYTTGYFAGNVDFDPGAGTTSLTAAGGDDIFVQKLNSSGDFLWARILGNALNEYGNAIDVDLSGNVYITGEFQGTVDFDPGNGTNDLIAAGGKDVYVQKMDANGNFIWARSFGGTFLDEGRSICVDNTGDVYTTGRFGTTVDFDPGSGTESLTSSGDTDVFVQKMNGAGDFVWAKVFGGTSTDFVDGITVDNLGNVYTSGFFQGTVDFDPESSTDSYSSAGIYDIFVHKLSQCISSFGTDVQTACDSYTWIDGNTYTSDNNTATFTLTNAAGCDSVVTLDLSITNVSDLTTTVSGASISAAITGASYQWLDCDNNNAVIPGETGQTFTASANGNYAVELTENGCVDTTDCVSITTVGLYENSFGKELTVYPNPTSRDFVIDLGSIYETTKISITDVFGRLIESKAVNQQQILHLSIDEPVGVYMISVEAGNKNAVIRLIKE